MNSSNYQKFCKELQDVIIRYPNLSLKEKNGKNFIKGILDINNEFSQVVGSYLVEIHFTPNFPFRFPVLFEVGGSIPNESDWHKYTDGSCCLTVLPDEILKCRAGITLLEFIEKYCCSFFANHIYKKLTGNYLNGEYSHGKDGLIEFYSELLRTKEFSKWIKYFRHVFDKAIYSENRNSFCLCGSNMKFKKCHKDIFGKMREIGEKQILKDFKYISL